MKALLLIVLILTAQGIAYSQNYILPSVLFDSLAFEVTQGRACSSALSGLRQETLWLDSVRTNQDEMLSLQADVIEAQNKIIGDWPKEVRANAEICEAEKERLKVKIRRLWRVVVTEAGSMAVIVIVLL